MTSRRGRKEREKVAFAHEAANSRVYVWLCFLCKTMHAEPGEGDAGLAKSGPSMVPIDGIIHSRVGYMDGGSSNSMMPPSCLPLMGLRSCCRTNVTDVVQGILRGNEPGSRAE